jgi:type IV pilus assembly protein PilE
MDRQRTFGFTLLEVFIVVATVSTVTAIAVPSYVNQLRKSARAEAQSFLVAVAAREQHYLHERGRYAADLESLESHPPANLSGKYAFAVAARNGPHPTFTVAAVAAGEQAKDACPALTLDSSGGRFPDACW